MAVVEQKLHARKELWFPYLVCKTMSSSRGAKLIRESLSKDDGNGNDDPTKQCPDWLNEEI